MAEIDNSENQNPDSSADLNAEELAAFQKIMGDIDGEEEEKSNGSAKAIEAVEKDEGALTEEDLVKPNEKIEITDDENRAEADMSDSVNPPGVDTEDDGDEGLDADQQKAFESIMAQIESGGLDETDSDKEIVETPETEAANGDTAKMEKGAERTDASNPTAPADAQNDDLSDDGLDQEQQQALQEIMDQIEGGGTEDAGAHFELEAVDARETEAGSSAELEKAVDKAAPAGRDENQDASPAEPKSALSGDHQQAVEETRTPIEGRDTEQAVPESTDAAVADVNVEQSSEDQLHGTGVPTDTKTDDEPEDISDDIDDILAEIASSDDASHPPETAVKASSRTAQRATTEAANVDADTAAREAAAIGGEPAGNLQAFAPTGKNGKPPASVENPLAKATLHDQPALNRPLPVRSKGSQQPEPLRESAKSTGAGKKRVILASVVIMLCLALAGSFFGFSQRTGNLKTDVTDEDTILRTANPETKPAFQEQNPVTAGRDFSDQSRLEAAAENLDRLRTELIEKQAEIRELRAYYQAGIDAEIKGVADRVRMADQGTMTFKSAIADPHIGLRMSAIQRRDTYIKKLEAPLDILFQKSEELLYLSRKAGVLALMAGKTSDIDIDGFIKQAEEISKAHRSELAQLNIDTAAASPRALVSIWRDIENYQLSTAIKSEAGNPVTGTKNAAIWKNICEGDFSQNDKLTDLSAEAARCLARYKGKDLFLNGLTDLSAEAARHLAAWQGDWLGLNGLRELSPDAAVHLSRWTGKGLSLNGLSRLSPRIVAILSDWQGDQIELVNLKHMAHWDNPKTRLFLSENMQRKFSTARN